MPNDNPLDIVTPKDTFESWRQKTNEIVHRLRSLYPHPQDNLYVNNNANISGGLVVDEDGIVKKNLYVKGNLFVEGQTTTLNTVNSTFKDNIIELNLDEENPDIYLGDSHTPSHSGIKVNRGLIPSDSNDSKAGTVASQQLYWDETQRRWVIEGDIDILGDLYSNGNDLWKSNGNNDIYYNTGNVGIGTDDPSSKLHVLNRVSETSKTSNKVVDSNCSFLLEDYESRLQLVACNQGSYSSTIVLSSVDSNLNSNNERVQSNWSLIHRSSNSGDGSLNKFQIAHQNVTTTDLTAPLADHPSNKYLTIDTSGKVGIGTENPTSTLEISKDDKENGAVLSITNSHNSTGDWAGGETIGSIDFRIDDTSVSNNNIRGQIKVFHDDENTALNYPAYTGMSFSVLNHVSGSPLNESLTERMRIDKDGNVGIGTESPSQRLHVLNSNGAAYGFFDSYRGEQYGGGIMINHARGTKTTPSQLLQDDYLGLLSFGSFLSSTFTRCAEIHAIATQNHSATAGGTKLILQTTENDTIYKQNRLVIDHNGNVGIGTIEPSAKLEVDGGSLRVEIDSAGSAAVFNGGGSNLHINLASGYTSFQNTSGDTDTSGFHFKGTSANPTSLLTIRNDGNVGIGTESPSEKLEVAGAIKLDISSNSTSELGTIRWTGSDFQGYMNTEIDGVQTPSWISLTSGQGAQGVGGKWTSSNQNQDNIYYNLGNVGIGHVNPNRKLNVWGDAQINGYLELSPTKINDLLTHGSGGEVALSGDGKVLVISDTSYIDRDPNSYSTIYKRGIIYTYDWNGHTWIERENSLLTAYTGDHEPQSLKGLFGSTISLNYDGSFLCVGCPYDDSIHPIYNYNIEQMGQVYVYKLNSSNLNWEHFETLTMYNPNDSHYSEDGMNANQQKDFFGFSVSISDDAKTIVAGHPGWDDTMSTTDPNPPAPGQSSYYAGFRNNGKIYIFERSSVNDQFTNYSNTLEYYYPTVNSNQKTDQEFGYQVTISGDGSIIYALRKRPTTNYGSNYNYHLPKLVKYYKNGSSWSIDNSTVLNIDDGVYDSISTSYDGSVVCIGDSSVTSARIYDWVEVGNSDYFYLRQSLQFDDLEQSQTSINGVTDNRTYFGRSVSISSDGGLLAVYSNTDVTGTSEGVITTCSLKANRTPLHNKLHNGFGSIPDSNDNIRFNTGIVSTSLDSGTVLISDTNKKITSSSITQTELESLSNITGNIEDRLDNINSKWANSEDLYWISGFSVVEPDGLHTYDNVGINWNKPVLSFDVRGDSYIEKSYSLPKLSNNLSSLDSENFQSFGESMSISADNKVLVVGVPEYQRVDGDDTFYGCVKTYDWNGSSWVSRNFLLENLNYGDNGTTYRGRPDSFGKSVSLSEDGKILVVGAPGDYDNSDTINDIERTGAAYIYIWNETNLVWDFFQYMRGLSLNWSSYWRTIREYGNSVSISGDGLKLCIGCPGYESSSNGNGENGVVHLYNRASITEQFTFDVTENLATSSITNQKIEEWMLIPLADDGEKLDWYAPNSSSTYIKSQESRFGHKVSLSGDGETLIICRTDGGMSGAYFYPNGGQTFPERIGNIIWTLKCDTSTGSFYSQDMFEESLLRPDANETDDHEVSSVSLSYDGKILALGCKLASLDYNQTGFVKIYDKIDTKDTFEYFQLKEMYKPEDWRSDWIGRGYPLRYHSNGVDNFLNSSNNVDSGRTNFGMSSVLSPDGSMLLSSSLDNNSSNGLVSTYSLSQNSKPLNQSFGIGFTTVNDKIETDGHILARNGITSNGITSNGGITITQGNTLKFTNPTDGQNLIKYSPTVGNRDVSILRVHENASDPDNNNNDTSSYGFTVKYMASGQGNENSFSIWSDNSQWNPSNPYQQLSSTPIEALRIEQDGTLWQAGVNEIYHTGNFTPKWANAYDTSGIYRDSKIGIGNFSSTALTDKLEVEGDEDQNVYIKVSANSSNDDHLSCGIKFENRPDVSGTYQTEPINFRFENLYNSAISEQGNDIGYTEFKLISYKPTEDVAVYIYTPYTEKHSFNGGISATGDIESLSDISVKENLEIIENPIEKIKELNGYTFNKNGEEKRSAGLIAQEVKKVLPEVVSENSDGIKSLAYGNIVALLVETVKEQQKQIDELKKQISNK